MMHAAQVDAFAAVEILTGLEVGRQWRAREGDDIQTLVVTRDVVIRDRHVRCVGH